MEYSLIKKESCLFELVSLQGGRVRLLCVFLLLVDLVLLIIKQVTQTLIGYVHMHGCLFAKCVVLYSLRTLCYPCKTLRIMLVFSNIHLQLCPLMAHQVFFDLDGHIYCVFWESIKVHLCEVDTTLSQKQPWA